MAIRPPNRKFCKEKRIAAPVCALVRKDMRFMQQLDKSEFMQFFLMKPGYEMRTLAAIIFP